MPFDSSGTFNRVTPGGWKADAQAGIKIRADRHDDEDDGFAVGLSTCLTKDGRTQPTANLPMNGKRFTNVGEPVDPSDGSTKKYVDDRFGTVFTITGVDDAGRITFAGSQSPLATGKPLGISFTQADLFFGVKPTDVETVGKVNRWVWNDKGDGMGTDVANMTETGAFTAASVTATGTVTAASVTATGTVTGGNVTTAGIVTSGAYFQATGANVILSATGGAVFLRPHGRDNAAGQAYVDSSGHLLVSNNVSAAGTLAAGTHVNPGAGASFNSNGHINVQVLGNFRCKDGLSGGYGGNYFGLAWFSGHMYCYVDNTQLGWFNFTSDYRIKKDIAPLASTWDKVKGFRPVSYTPADYGELFKSSDDEHWGFVAHEIQEDLLPTAASGEKDIENAVQGLDWMPIMAATVKALQEAMARIEALEAQLAGAP